MTQHESSLPIKFHAFISYQHDDSAVAKKIHRSIERYQLPKGLRTTGISAPLRNGRLYPAFLYEYDSAGGRPLDSSLEEYVTQSACLVVVFSSANTHRSSIVPDEIHAFAKVRGPARIVPVVVEGEHPGCIPKSVKIDLAPTSYIDMRKSRNVLKRENRLKLMARVAEVPFEELLAHDTRRQNHWRMAGVAGICVFVLLLVGSIAKMKQEINAAALAKYHAEGIIDIGIYNSQLIASRDGVLEHELDTMLGDYFRKVNEEDDGDVVEVVRSATFLELDTMKQMKGKNFGYAIGELDQVKAKLEYARTAMGGQSYRIDERLRTIDTLKATLYIEGQHDCFQGSRLIRPFVQESDALFREDYEEEPSRMAALSFEYASCLAVQGSYSQALDVLNRSIRIMEENYNGNEYMPQENLVMLLRSLAGADIIAATFVEKTHPDIAAPLTLAYIQMVHRNASFGRQLVHQYPDNILLADQFGILLLIDASVNTSLSDEKEFENERRQWQEVFKLLDREVKSKVSCQCLLPYKRAIQECIRGPRERCVAAQAEEQASILKTGESAGTMMAY